MQLKIAPRHNGNLTSNYHRQRHELKHPSTRPNRAHALHRYSSYLGGNSAFLKDAGLEDSEKIIWLSDYDLPWKGHANSIIRKDQDIITEKSARLSQRYYYRGPTMPCTSSIYRNTQLQRVAGGSPALSAFTTDQAQPLLNSGVLVKT